MYFKDIKNGDRVYSLIYGEGVVYNVLDEKRRIDGFYMMEVKFKKDTVHYTEGGIPNWCQFGGCSQTLYYMKDIDVSKIDFEPNNKVLSLNKITRGIDKGDIEMRCPSGLWRNTLDCPPALVEKGLGKLQLHLFRKEKYNGTERRNAN